MQPLLSPLGALAAAAAAGSSIAPDEQPAEPLAKAQSHSKRKHQELSSGDSKQVGSSVASGPRKKKAKLQHVSTTGQTAADSLPRTGSRRTDKKSEVRKGWLRHWVCVDP